jgi:hypothetical protein
VAALDIPGKVQKNGQMGMPAPDKNKMLSHGSPIVDTYFFLRQSGEEEKMKTRFSGSFSVIPVKTGIQEIQELLDSRLRGSDTCGDFSRGHQG